MGEVSAIEKKLAGLGLEQTPEDFVESLAPPIKKRVEALQKLQEKRDELEAEFRIQRAELELKYEKLYGPLYSERAAVVAGSKEVEGAEGASGIPEFWVTVLLKCDVTAELIKDKDLDVLNFLTDIKSENIHDERGFPTGFKLFFHFSENPFFTNSVLEKTYVMLPDDDGVLEKAEGTKIEWAQGKDVTVKIMKKKPKKGKADAKPQTKVEKVESFFNFFSPPEVPGEDDEVDEDAMEELQAVIEADYEVGATIREKIIPKAVSWYTGEAVDDEPYYMDGDEEYDDDDDEGADEDEDEDEDADDSPAPKGKGKKGGAAAQKPPDCKQQ